MPTAKPKEILFCRHLGRVWVGCEHGTRMNDDGPPLFCFSCLEVYVEYLQRNAAAPEEPAE